MCTKQKKCRKGFSTCTWWKAQLDVFATEGLDPPERPDTGTACGSKDKSWSQRVGRINRWISRQVRPGMNVEFFFSASSSTSRGFYFTYKETEIQVGRFRQLQIKEPWFYLSFTLGNIWRNSQPWSECLRFMLPKTSPWITCIRTTWEHTKNMDRRIPIPALLNENVRSQG